MFSERFCVVPITITLSEIRSIQIVMERFRIHEQPHSFADVRRGDSLQPYDQIVYSQSNYSQKKCIHALSLTKSSNCSSS